MVINSYDIKEQLHGELVGDWSMVCFCVGRSGTVSGSENVGKILEVGINKQRDSLLWNRI